MNIPERVDALARELSVDRAEIEEALGARGWEPSGPFMLVPGDVAEEIRILFGGAVAPEHRGPGSGTRDADYRKALGLAPGERIPKELGTISGNGKRSKPGGTTAAATRRAADRTGGSQIARETFEKDPPA